MTYSIIAQDPRTGEIGIAVASRFFACGVLVPWISETAAVASQAFANPLWGVEGLSRMKTGEDPAAILSDFLSRDAGAGSRQAHFLAHNGQIAQHTGISCVPWAGHVSAANISVAGNMLVGPSVVQDTLASFLIYPELPFAERLLTAMEAGETAGGDRRGRQAASLVVHAGEAYPSIDIRTDDHADPLAELRRLYAVSKEHYSIFATTMATSANFSGMIDRQKMDVAISEDEAYRKQNGISSQSFALPPT